MNQPSKSNRANSSRPRVYESGVDLWIGIMLLLGPVLTAVLGIHFLMNQRPGDAMTMFLVGAITMLITAMFTTPCRYTLLSDALSVRCGIICYQVPFTDIKTVEKSGTWISGPALSMKRVIVSTQKRNLILSPKDRDEFIADLRECIG